MEIVTQVGDVLVTKTGKQAGVVVRVEATLYPYFICAAF